MALVGDVILSFREQATDLPQAYPPPSVGSVTPLSIPNASFPPGQPINFVVSTIGTWGETVASNESLITLTAPNNALFLSVNTFPNSTALRVYYSVGGGGSGAELMYEEYAVPVTAGVQSVPIVVVNQGVNGFPPNRSTAYNPDADGMAVGAYAAYRWLNQALTWGAAKNNGIPAAGAFGTVSGQPLYILPGWWRKITNAWYDGYPLYLGRRNDAFRRGNVPGVVGTLLMHEATDRMIVELWPQPSRTSCQTTLVAPINAVSDSAQIANSAGWVLGFGKARIGSEIVEYQQQNGNVLQGLTRGLVGSTATSHDIGEAVVELNLEFSGSRMPSGYSVGAALSTLLCPPGWENPLQSYMLYKFRSAEQDDNGAMRFLKEATDMIGDLRAGRIIAGPRQIQANAGRGAETMAGLGSPFGGVIVP
jgi:hypothetical protein